MNENQKDNKGGKGKSNFFDLDWSSVAEPTLEQLMDVDDIYSKFDASMITNFKEDNRIERKPARISEEFLGEYICMWGNTQPNGGIIIVGVENDGAIEGCNHIGTDKCNKLEKAGYVFCSDAKYDSKKIPVQNKKGEQDFLMIFRVFYHETRVIKTSKGRVYRRLGDSKIELKTPDSIRQLQADKGEINIEDEPSNLNYPKDFDLNLIKDFTDSYKERKKLEEEHDNEDILCLAKLGKMRDGVFIPSIACALLFAKDTRDVIAGCRIRFLRFDGEAEGSGENWNAVKDEWIDGQVPKLIKLAEQILDSQLREFSRLGKDGKFYTTPEYPRFAWYEAIVNACVHRSYANGMRNMPIFVKMFDDRLEIESPGGFPPLVTPENIYNIHHPRNPWLMGAMYYLKFVKQAHEGTKRMRSLMVEHELPAPEFLQEQITHTAVRVILRNNIKHRKIWIDTDVSQLIGEAIAQSLTEQEKRILNFAAEYGSLNVSDAQRLISSTWRTASNVLKRLAGKNFLIYEHRKDIERDPKARYNFPRNDLKKKQK